VLDQTISLIGEASQYSGCLAPITLPPGNGFIAMLEETFVHICGTIAQLTLALQCQAHYSRMQPHLCPTT
jgi:hypothetical protein